jgi:hypothetical protein
MRQHLRAKTFDLRRALTALFLAVVILGLQSSHTLVLATDGDEALSSTIPLQMPFVAGELWTVGGSVYFYGEGGHTNVANDYYATDWNRLGDTGATVLPIAAGFVNRVRDQPCPLPNTTGFGCFVEIIHPDGYLSLYAHLEDVFVAQSDQVQTWDRIGTVGETGGAQGAHLHLRFQRIWTNGQYYSRCNTPVNPQGTCENGIALMAPQGHKPSSMWTASGAVDLIDGNTYKSVNGRVHWVDIREDYADWTSKHFVRNDSPLMHTILSDYLYSNGSLALRRSCILASQDICEALLTAIGAYGTSARGTAFADGSEATSGVTENVYDGNGIQHLVATNYTSIAPADQGLNADWGRASPVLYAPNVKYNRYGSTVDLYIQNTGSASTNVTVRYYNSNGTEIGSLSCSNLPAKGQCVVTIPDARWGDNLILSAIITSSNGQALAGVATDRTHGLPPTKAATHHLLGLSDISLYAPTIKKQRYGHSTGIRVQNIGSSNTWVRITYYDSVNTNIQYTSSDYLVPPNAAVTIYEDPVLPTNFVGSAKIESLVYGQRIVAQVNKPGVPTAPLVGHNAVMSDDLKANSPRVIAQCGGAATAK